MQSRLQMGLLRTLHVDLQQDYFISSAKTLSVSNKWDFSASETDFSLSCIFHISCQQKEAFTAAYMKFNQWKAESRVSCYIKPCE